MIGIFGGAFDPPHQEHIRIAEEIRKEFSLREIVFVPSGNSPHKLLETPFETRCAMLRAATIDKKDLRIDEIEGSYAATAYSYKILPFLKEKYGAIAFLIGGDSLLAFDRWRCPDRILKICPLIVIPRGKDDLSELQKAADRFVGQWGGKIMISKQVRGANISSTILRAKACLGMPIAEVDDRVRQIIDENGLYREYSDIAQRVKGMLQEKRWRHTCGVVIAGLKINARIGLSDRKVFLACLLHDCMKQTDRVNPGVPEDVIGSKVLHAFNGAEEARLAFGIEDPEILDAIRYHTTGRACMTPLDKLVYTADMVEEETRDFEGVEELRAAAYRDIDLGFKLCFKQCYDLLLEKGNPIYHLSSECFNEYCKGE